MRKSKSQKVPKQMQEAFAAVTALTDVFCTEHLNDEYAQLARQMAAALCRKRPSPMETGRANSWACGILYALGYVNFLFDRSNEPSMSAEDLCAGFGLSKSAGYNRSRQIRDLFDLMPFHPDWCLPGKLEKNPLVWMLSVNGLLVDIRTMPREVQEIAYQKGLIPYIPADRRK